METLESRIKHIRGERTQEEFGTLLGTTKQNISRYERGDTKPGYEQLELFLLNFNINLNWLFTGKGRIYYTDMDFQNKENANLLELYNVQSQFIKYLKERNNKLNDVISIVKNLKIDKA